MRTTVRYCAHAHNCPWRNAFWDGHQTVFGEHLAVDDIVGHEIAHAVTEFTSGLFYYEQSGAINESLSDVFGELVDLTNGRGGDADEVRWKLGEDTPSGASRDMRRPTAFGDPDRVRSSHWFNAPIDNGGVHTNSGVGNKAASLLTDGGTFNGRIVTGLGIDKVARLYYEVNTALLTRASSYNDLYDALQQACVNLTGTAGFTAADCKEVKDAVSATEMDLQPVGSPTPTAPDCTATGDRPVFAMDDDLEDPEAGRWATSVAVGSSSPWYYPQNDHPYGTLDATYATSGRYNFWGEARGHVTDASIAMTRGVTVPAGAFLTFRHAHFFEGFYSEVQQQHMASEGGLVEYSADGGPWTDAAALFTHYGPGHVVRDDGAGNPLVGRRAWSGRSFGYAKSRASLASLAGRSVRLRFRLGTDNFGINDGWWIDDVRILTCSPDTTKPVVRPPTASLVPGTALATAGTTGRVVPMRIAFPAATDDRALAGDLRYKLQRAVGTSATPAYADVTDWTTHRPAEQPLVPGQTYRYRVLARDPAGNVSTAAAGAPFTPSLRQEDDAAVTYGGTWIARAADPTASGGHLRATKLAGSRARTTVTGARGIGVVLRKAPELGTARVCLYAGSSTTGSCQAIDSSPASELALGPRRIAFARGLLSPATSYRVEVTAVTGRLELDGLVVVR